MKVKYVTDTEARDFEAKINKVMEEIGGMGGRVRGITSTVTHPNKMRGDKVVGVGNLFSCIVAYEE